MLLVNSGDDSTGADAGVGIVNPWEERKDRGRFSALVASLVLLATAPRKFFEGTRPDAGIWGPLLFAGLVTLIYMVLGSVVFTVLILTLPDQALEFVYETVWRMDPSQFPTAEELPFGTTLFFLFAFQVLLLALPALFALTLVATLIVGALVHLLLVVTRTSRPHGFRGTWVAICYANGANLLGIVPIAGELLATFCGAVLFGIGLHVVQRVGVIRAAVLASILPLLVLLGLLIPRVLPNATS
ncbi:MAG: YIP1 family protein [Acidobacteria bacterium]|nr:YIP1 family protein [Acidobacteriota bacterium]